MLTLKHVEHCGTESLFQAVNVFFSPTQGAQTPSEGGQVLRAFGSPGPDEGARLGGTLSFSNGTVYVMNDGGKTVAIYHLDSPAR